jgi:YidC/Oxa1 family membrane protein insertase
MDKRSFLAIAVTFVILLVWQMLYIAPQQKKAAQRKEALRIEQAARDSAQALEEGSSYQEPQDTAAAPSETAEETVQDRELPAEGMIKPRADAAEKKIMVRTRDMNVWLTSYGGEVTKVELDKYERKSGGPVELIPEGERGAAALSIEKDGRWQKLSALDFDVTVNGREAADGEKIDLTGQSGEAEIVFSRTGKDGARIEKHYRFSSEGYEVELSVSITREGELRQSQGYAVSWESGIALNEKDHRGELRQLAALGRVGEENYKEGVGKFSKEKTKGPNPGMVSWAGVRSKYFLCALITKEERSGALVLLGDRDRTMVGWSVQFPFRGDPRQVSDTFALYMGPLDMKALKAYDVGLEKTIDLGRMRFFSTFILRLMIWMKKFIPNYGLIIIIFSVLTKVLFYRLTHKSFKSMKDMQKLQPRLKELQEKYKDEKEKLNKETMKLYKEAGVNPLGGCLPLLLQMPVFLALFNVLRNTIELRGAPFAWWIKDLSSPDVLFSFGARLPFLGNEFHLLPILMGGAMLLQSKMGGGQTTPAAQTKMMTAMMPIVFTFIFYSMPSGLVLYWLVNNLFAIIQQYYVQKEIEKEEKEVKVAAV